MVFIVGGTTYEEARAVALQNNTASGVKFVLGGTVVHNSARSVSPLNSAILSLIIASFVEVGRFSNSRHRNCTDLSSEERGQTWSCLPDSINVDWPSSMNARYSEVRVLHSFLRLRQSALAVS